MHAIIRESQHSAQTRERFLTLSEFAPRSYARLRIFHCIDDRVEHFVSVTFYEREL
jgi:hypothetical protein